MRFNVNIMGIHGLMEYIYIHIYIYTYIYTYIYIHIYIHNTQPTKNDIGDV
jgi:hypothetical protein